MSREWQPGDLALVEAGCWANRKVALRLAEGWSHVNGVNFDDDGVVSPIRPLVVIDPEDWDAIARFAERQQDFYFQSGASPAQWNDLGANQQTAVIDATQAALRELANPTPRIEEPTGMGAVVLDAEGVHWVHLEQGIWFCLKHGRENWAGINAVRVLLPGVEVSQ